MFDYAIVSTRAAKSFTSFQLVSVRSAAGTIEFNVQYATKIN